MNRESLEKLMVALLLMTFVFALGNIIFNLEVLNIGDDSFPDMDREGSIDFTDTQPNEALADSVRWIWFGFLAVCGLAVVIGAVSFAKSGDRKKWRKLFFQVAGVLLIIGLIFAFGYFYQDIKGSITGGGTTVHVPTSGGNTTTNVTGDEAGTPDSLRVVIMFGVFALIFMFCIVVMMAVNNIIRMRSTKLDYSDIERDTQEVAQTIQRTIDALAGGSDTRATVIRCYTDMCKVMAKYGVKEEEHLTPREFQKIAIDTLPVPEEHMRALVDIFEEARYSQHKLGEGESAKALKALEDVRANLMKAKPEPPAAAGGP